MPTPVYALADLHLTNISRDVYGMERYGGAWVGHPENLFAGWRRAVPDDALVFVPGDITLETRPDAASEDLALVDQLPGFCKPMVKGNHDLGFGRTLSKWKAQCEPFGSLLPLLGSAARVDTPDGSVIVAGTKGAYVPSDPFFAARFDDDTDSFVADRERETHNRKLYERELRRLTRALEEAVALRAAGEPLIVSVHYPPFANMTQASEYTNLIESADANLCLFGHLHWDEHHQRVFQGRRQRTEYRLCAADYLRMVPRQVAQVAAGRLTVF
jgi:predicted phosphohydrolase